MQRKVVAKLAPVQGVVAVMLASIKLQTSKCLQVLFPLQSKVVAGLAAETVTATLKNMNPNGVRLVLPMIFDSMNQKQKWQVKVGALQQLSALTKIAPDQMKAALPDIVPAVTGCFADAKPQVKVHNLHATGCCFCDTCVWL